MKDNGASGVDIIFLVSSDVIDLNIMDVFFLCKSRRKSEFEASHWELFRNANDGLVFGKKLSLLESKCSFDDLCADFRTLLHELDGWQLAKEMAICLLIVTYLRCTVNIKPSHKKRRPYPGWQNVNVMPPRNRSYPNPKTTHSSASRLKGLDVLNDFNPIPPATGKTHHHQNVHASMDTMGLCPLVDENNYSQDCELLFALPFLVDIVNCGEAKRLKGDGGGKYGRATPGEEAERRRRWQMRKSDAKHGGMKENNHKRRFVVAIFDFQLPAIYGLCAPHIISQTSPLCKRQIVQAIRLG
ncbi:hypothetical protein ACLOJK_011461 [Asimina triloba]